MILLQYKKKSKKNTVFRVGEVCKIILKHVWLRLHSVCSFIVFVLGYIDFFLFFCFFLLFCQWCQGMWMLYSLGRGLSWFFFFFFFLCKSDNHTMKHTQTHASTDQLQVTTGRASVEQKGAQFSREAFLHVSTPPTDKRSFLSSANTAWVGFFFPRHNTDAMLLTRFEHKEVNAAILCHWEIFTSHPARHLLVSLCFKRKNWHHFDL